MTGNLRLPPGQQLVAEGKWPLVGERLPREDASPWTVSIGGMVEQPRQFSLDELAALEQTDRHVDIHCVTRWSKLDVPFRGVPLGVLLKICPPLPVAKYVSFVARSERRHSTSLLLEDALELDTLVALACEGRPLEKLHGGPVRVVVPGRYFYKSLKWLERIELLETDRLGYWEQTAGYHNTADPWQEQRYMAPQLDRFEVRRVLESRDFSGRDLRSIDASGRDLAGLNARGALLRDADFRRAKLNGACFEGANLSNAHFAEADLREASFAGADLEGADFSGADLRGANLRGTLLTAATFCDQGKAAHIDAATQIEPEDLEPLMPDQREFWRRHPRYLS